MGFQTKLMKELSVIHHFMVSFFQIFFPNLLPCNTKSFDREIRNDDEFAYRQESAVHVSDDQTAAAFFHI